MNSQENQESDTIEFNDDNCVVCGKSNNGKEKIKFILKDKRATKIFESSRKFSDDVFRRTSNVMNITEFAALKLKYHNSCMLRYERNSNSLTEQTNVQNTSQSNMNKSLEQTEAVFSIIQIIEPN